VGCSGMDVTVVRGTPAEDPRVCLGLTARCFPFPCLSAHPSAGPPTTKVSE